MEELIKYLIEEVTGINDFSIEQTSEDGKVIFTVNVIPEYVGLVIGKGGKTIKAIQNLLRIRGKLEKRSVFINVVERS